MARFGYAEADCVTVTPGVDVESVAETDVSLAQPLFLSGSVSFTHSLRLMTPLLLPLVASSMAKPFVCRFDDPDMQKFCVVVAPGVAMTETVAGGGDVQLRAEAAGLGGLVSGRTGKVLLPAGMVSPG